MLVVGPLIKLLVGLLVGLGLIGLVLILIYKGIGY